MVGANRTAALALGLALALAIPAAADAQDKTVTIALPANVNTLDPHNSSTVPTDLSVAAHIYTPMVDRGSDLKLRPGLAQSWEAIDDNTWRFHLAEGVTFADGEPLDAEAVKWNMERILDENNNLRIRTWFRPIDEIRVIDPTTIEFHTKKPYPALADQMAMFFLMPPKWAQEHNPSAEALGSGPYQLERFTSGDRVVLSAREDYWGEAPEFDKVVFRIIPEDASRIAALQTGEVDLITVFPPSDVERLDGRDGIKAGAVPSTRFMFVKYNTLKEPFKDNPTLWRALNYAVDRQAIIDNLWSGMGEIANCQPLSPAYFGYNEDLKPYPYDPEKAKQLLAEAGYPDGLEVELETTIGRYIQATDIAQIVAAQLGQIGVTVNIHEMEFGRWLDKYRVAGDLGQMAYFGLAWPTLDADGLLSFWESTNDQAFYVNEDFDRLIREARSTTDQEKRKALYDEATELLCETPPQIFMFFQPLTYAESDRVNWHARGDDWVRVMDMDAK